MYSLIIHLYSLIIELIAPFHKKARTMRLGQWRTNQILRSQIQPGEKYIWFHAASLGEFEQGRPMMEKIKAQYPQYKILLTSFLRRDMRYARIMPVLMSSAICLLTHLIGSISS